MKIDKFYNIYVLNEIAEALEGFNEDELLKSLGFWFLVSQGHNERDIIESGLEGFIIR